MPALQVRDVPDELQRILKRRAAEAGQSLSEYVLGELQAIAARPTIAELNERVALRGRVDLHVPAAQILLDERARR